MQLLCGNAAHLHPLETQALMPEMASVSIVARFARDNVELEVSLSVPAAGPAGLRTTASDVQQFLSKRRELPQGFWAICDARMRSILPGEQVEGPLLAISKSITHSVVRAADKHGRCFQGFSAAPMAEAHRQDVRFVESLPLLMELMDNAITYSADSTQPNIRVEYAPLGFPHGSGLPEIRVTDRGGGMGKEGAQGYFVEGYTTAGEGPKVQRGTGPLKFADYFSPDLSRYGQGSLAVVKFGDSYELITREKGSPVVHCVRVDYQAWIEKKDHACVYATWIDMTDDFELYGSTSITIGKLHERVEKDFSDPAITRKWLRQVTQDYHFLIHGIPDELWDAVSPKLKEGTRRPKGGVNLYFLGTRLAPGREVEMGVEGERYTKETPALLRVLAALKENKRKHAGLKPCVMCFRYYPPSVAPPVAVSDVAGPSEPAGSKRGAGGRTSAAAKKQRLSDAAAGGSRTLAAALPELLPVEQGLDIFGKRLSPVDMLVLFFYCPFEEGDTVGLKQTKPCDEDECELFMLPFWCCRFITNNRVSTQFPRIVEYAKKLAGKDANIKAQGTSFKLDKSRLVGFIFMSPDSDVSTHKTDIADPAFLAFLNAGVDSANPREPPSGGHLFTYHWGGNGSVEGFRQERVDNAAAPYKSLAAIQLCETFCTEWHNLDEGGRIVMRKAGGTEEEGDGAFDDMQSDDGTSAFLCQGTKFTKKSLVDPLEGKRDPKGGEMVKLVSEGQGFENSVATGRKTRAGQARAKDHYLLHFFYETGSEGANVHHAVISQWRPSWGTPCKQISKSVLCLEPVSAKPGEYSTSALRLAQAKKLSSDFEAKAPRWLCLTSDLTSNAAVENVASCKYLNASYSVQAEKPKAFLVVVACKSAITKKVSTFEASSLLQMDFATNVSVKLRWKALPSAGAPNTASRSQQLYHGIISPRSPAGVEFVAEGWTQDQMQRPGQYTFEFMPNHENLPAAKGGWFDAAAPTLTCGFVVEQAQPVKMVARWEIACEGESLPLARVGELPPAIILQLLDNQDRPMACNLSGEQLEQHSDRVVAIVNSMERKHLPTSAKCTYVDSATRREIRVQLGKFPHMLIAANASYADQPLSLELRLGDLAQGGDGNRARDTGAAGAPVLTTTVPRKFRLASASFPGTGFILLVDRDSIFRSSTADNPPEVTKSAHVFDESLAIRLKDRSGNFFYQDTDDVPPSLVVRVEAGLTFTSGSAVLTRSYVYKSDMCQYTIDAGTCEMVAVPCTKCMITATVAGVSAPLVGFVISRPVILGWEIGSKKGTSGVLTHVLDLFNFINVGKDRVKNDWTQVTVPEAVLEGHKALIEFGGSKVWLSPRGDYYSAPFHVSTNGIRDRMPLDLVTALNSSRSKAGASCYDFAFTVPVDRAMLPGVVLTFAHQQDNMVLAGFETTVKVMYSGTSIFPDIELKVKDGKTSLKKIKVGDMFKDAGKIVQTLKLSVLDADPLKAGQTQPFQYGSFYLRQAPYPCTLSLAPVRGSILDAPGGLKVVLVAKNLKGSLQHKAQTSSSTDRTARQSVGSTSTGATAAEPLDFVSVQSAASTSRSGTGNIITIGQLVRHGFRVEAPGPRPAGRQFRLDFLILNQHGVPMEVSDKLKKHFELEAQAVVRQGSTDANSAAGENLCELSGWVWKVDDGSGSVQHSSVSVLLPPNLSEDRADFILRLDIPDTLDPQSIPGQVDSLELCMPITVRSFRQRVVSKGLTCSAVWETKNGKVAGARAVRQAASVQQSVLAGINPHVSVAVSCMEDSSLDVEFSLKDGGNNAAQDAEFLVVDSTLPALAGQKLAVGTKMTSNESKLLLQFKLGVGSEWCKTHTVTLKASEAGYENILPIKLLIKAAPSNRLTHTVSLCEWPEDMMAAAGSSTDQNVPQGDSQEPVVPNLEMALSNATHDREAAPGYLPALRVQLVTANGEMLPTAQLKPMQLLLKVQGEGRNAQWLTSATFQLQPQQDMLFETESDQVPVSGKAGTFQVVLQYPGLAPLVVALLTTTAAPAVGLSYSPLYVVPPELQNPRSCLNVATTDASSRVFPQVQIMLVDRWKNPATRTTPVEVRFTTQPADLAKTPTAADNIPNIGSNLPPNLIPAGGSSITLPACSFASFNILEDSDDIALWLVPHILQHPAINAQRTNAAAADEPADTSLSSFLLATYHVSSLDVNTLRSSIAALKQAVIAEERKKDVADSAFDDAKEALQVADATVSRLHKDLHQLGVANPEHASQIQAVIENLQQAADAITRNSFRGPAWVMLGGGGNVPMLDPVASQASLLHRVAPFRQMAAAAQRVPGGLGPVVLLGAIERDDVNLALLGHINRKLKMLLVQGARGKQALQGLSQRPKGTPILDLTDPSINRYKLQAAEEDTAHPQRPLFFSRLRDKFQRVLAMDGEGPRDGFVGMAANLIHMPAPLDNLRVTLQQQPNNNNAGGRGAGRGANHGSQGTTYSLRQTLWYYLFHELMVFEHSQAIEGFLDRCRAAGIVVDQKLLALDGASHNMMDQGVWVDVEEGKKQYNGELLMAKVPADASEAAPLDLRLVRAKAEISQKRKAAATIIETRNELPNAEFDLSNKQTLHDGQEKHSTKVGQDVTKALEGFRAQLVEEEAQLVKLMARQAPVPLQSRTAAAFAKRGGRASVGGQAGTSGRA